jgi:hypothetical protein
MGSRNRQPQQNKTVLLRIPLPDFWEHILTAPATGPFIFLDDAEPFRVSLVNTGVTDSEPSASKGGGFRNGREETIMKTVGYLCAAAAVVAVTTGSASAQVVPPGECISTTPRRHFLVQGWIGFS